MSSLISFGIIIAHSVFVLEDLVFNKIIIVFMWLFNKTCFNKIVFLELEFTALSNSHLVELLSDLIILWVKFKISLKVISVLLLLFSKSTKEICVIISPSFSLSFKHSLFTSIVVIGVGELSRVEFLNLVEESIEFSNRLLNIEPGFIEIFTVWCWHEDLMSSQLSVNFDI